MTPGVIQSPGNLFLITQLKTPQTVDRGPPILLTYHIHRALVSTVAHPRFEAPHGTSLHMTFGCMFPIGTPLRLSELLLPVRGAELKSLCAWACLAIPFALQEVLV